MAVGFVSLLWFLIHCVTMDTVTGYIDRIDKNLYRKNIKLEYYLIKMDFSG